MSAVLARLRSALLEPEHPQSALEVRARALGIVRRARAGDGGGLAAAASLELPEGALRLSMTEPNIADPEAFRRVLRALVERAGIQDGARIGLVLPDPVARVALLPASEARARRAAETEELLRFRLRKAVPFDVREARLAWRASGGGPDAQVLAVAIFAPVLDAYEEACRAVGLEPGLVELAGLALLDAVEAGRPAADRAVVNWDDEYVSIAIARGGQPVLHRTLTGVAASEPEQVVREAANTVLYYRERLGGTGLQEAALRCAVLPPEDAARLLAQGLGVTPRVVEPLGKAPGGDGAAAQALAGALACLARRVA